MEKYLEHELRDISQANSPTKVHKLAGQVKAVKHSPYVRRKSFYRLPTVYNLLQTEGKDPQWDWYFKMRAGNKENQH